MIEYLVLILVLIAFTIASIEDLKKREVYDYINFSLAFAILIVAIFHSLIINSFEPIKYVSFGMTIGFAFGAFLFYLGIWGGGDSKFLLGFSGAAYYLLNFTLPVENAGFVYQYFLTLMSDFFTLFLDTFLGYILILDAFFILLLLTRFIGVKNRRDVENLLFLFVVLLLLTLGLYYQYNQLTLVLIGFVVFILIFLAREGAFGAVYIKIQKDYLQLKAGDKIDENLLYKNKKLVEIDESGITTLSKEQIHEITSNVKEEGNDVYVRKIIPYSTLIGLNYVVYLFKVVTIQDLAFTNLSILSFMLKFLFYSFMAGGLLAVLLVFYLFIRNFHKVKMNFSKIEKMLSVPGLFLITTLVYLFGPKLALLYLLYPVYFFVKIAKAIESFAFVKEKALDEIVLGDWVVQDIQVGKKMYYEASDFKIGIDEFQLAKIKELAKHNISLRKLYVKDGIAFLPALYVGFLLMFLI